MGVWLQMEKVKDFFHNLSLKKSMACYIVLFAALALLLGNITEGLCYRASAAVNEKYRDRQERYYLTNEAGEQLGEGTYVWRGGAKMTEADQRLTGFLDVFPMIMYPVYSAICVMAAAALFYRNKMREPVRLLTEASDKISKNELDFTLDYPCGDEMGMLCRSFEAMRLALEQNQKEMWRTMEERKELNAAFAHDLRTPLTVLKGYNEMIQLTGGEKEQVTAGIMEKHILRMQNYVESMGSIQRLEDREPFWQSTSLDEYMVMLKDFAVIVCREREKKLSFVQQITSGVMILEQEFIFDVFQNLLSNAVRYARETITILIREADGLTITVSDDGPGFSEKALRNALQPYYREAGKPSVPEEGQEDHFGLGLYISRILCGRHGGELKLENTETGGRVIASFIKKQ